MSQDDAINISGSKRQAALVFLERFATTLKHAVIDNHSPTAASKAHLQYGLGSGYFACGTQKLHSHT
jgi:hypothetical protein